MSKIQKIESPYPWCDPNKTYVVIVRDRRKEMPEPPVAFFKRENARKYARTIRYRSIEVAAIADWEEVVNEKTQM